MDNLLKKISCISDIVSTTLFVIVAYQSIRRIEDKYILYAFFISVLINIITRILIFIKSKKNDKATLQ